MTGGHALVKTLVAHGVEQAFCVPGEFANPFAAALRDDGPALGHVQTDRPSGHLGGGAIDPVTAC